MPPTIQSRMVRKEKAVELRLSRREMLMIEALEKVATGTSGIDPETDLEIIRDIAFETLEQIGWPTARAEVDG